MEETGTPLVSSEAMTTRPCQSPLHPPCTSLLAAASRRSMTTVRRLGTGTKRLAPSRSLCDLTVLYLASSSLYPIWLSLKDAVNEARPAPIQSPHTTTRITLIIAYSQKIQDSNSQTKALYIHNPPRTSPSPLPSHPAHIT